ncbi:MAG: hypothetical protein ACJ70Y_05630 [Nitrososphaera sp.]
MQDFILLRLVRHEDELDHGVFNSHPDIVLTFSMFGLLFVPVIIIVLLLERYGSPPKSMRVCF